MTATVCLMAGAALLASPSASRAQHEATPPADAVRLLWTPGTVAAGKTEVEVLPIDQDIRRLVFLVDGEQVEVRKKPPWRAKIRFDEPPRVQQLTVRAYGPGDRLLGEDSAEINRVDRPFRVLLDSAEGSAVSGRVSVPRGAELEQVTVKLDGQAAGSSGSAEFRIELAQPLRSQQVVRAIARLRDGREIENATVVGVEDNSTTIDVRLVQIQTLVADRDGRPLAGLEAGDFRVLENRRERQIDRVQPAQNVSLNLGLVLDTSGSIESIWPLVREAAMSFLGAVVTARDEAFLVDFATNARLVHRPTSDLRQLESAIAELEIGGMTALYDAIAFSILQFGDRPGRRALVVITDGEDFGSQADPERSVELGQKLGVPVYVVFIPNPDRDRGRPANTRQIFDRGGRLQEIKLFTESTGGRLLRIGGGVAPSAKGLERAFRIIAAELRSQYLITYYTDQALADLDARAVEVEVPSREKVDVRSLLAWDQIQ